MNTSGRSLSFHPFTLFKIHIALCPFVDPTAPPRALSGLSWDSRSESLLQYFSQFGQIVEAVVLIDKMTGRSKGYGFVRCPTAVSHDGRSIATCNSL